MTYAQSILWLILSALCMAQCLAKLRKPDADTPVNFSYENTHCFECSNNTFFQNASTGKVSLVVYRGHELDPPFEMDRGDIYSVEYDALTTEIKINGVVVRKGTPKP